MEQTRQIVPNLSHKEERRLDDLFQMFCKSEPNKIKFHEFFMFCIDRQILSPRITFAVLYDLFLDCIDEEDIIQTNDKEKVLNKNQFNFLLVQLSRIAFSGLESTNNLDRLYDEIILAEKSVANKDAIEATRIPLFDDQTRKILTEPSINALIQFQEDLQSSFIAYLSENYEQNEILLSWHEICLQKRKLSSHGFVRFLKEAQIIPNKLGIENIEDYMHKILPPVTTKEHEFYSKKRVIQIYEKEMEELDRRQEGDPGMHFYEFQLLLCRIAYEERRKRNDDKFDIEQCITYFFEHIMEIRKNDEIQTREFPNINKKLYSRLNKYYEELNYNKNQLNQGSEVEGTDEETRDPYEMLAELQTKQIFEVDPVQFDVQDIYNILEKDLPKIPPLPHVEQENPPPYKMGEKPKKKKDKQQQIKFVIGDQVPKEPPSKNQKVKPKPPKKKQLKKGEKPPKPILFAGFPPPDPKLGYDYLEKLNNELTYGEKLLSNVNRGTMDQIEVIPLLLQEILYPPNCPNSVRPLIECAINSYNQSNYIMAIKNFQDGKIFWKNNEEMTEQINLFFEFSKASVYSSAGRDDYALYYFMQCKAISDKLPYTCPDRSLSYCGIGTVLYNTEEYELSLRAFLKAREIREKLFGSEHIDTACVYNNLGCCMFMLDRNQEAVAYFKISHAILELELGVLNNRTMVIAQNIKKTEKGFFNNVPAFKTLWEAYEDDAFKKKKKKKKKKK